MIQSDRKEVCVTIPRVQSKSIDLDYLLNAIVRENSILFKILEMINCISCNFPYPDDHVPYRCPKCGDLFDFSQWPHYDPDLIEDEPGIWRYRHTFGLPDHAPTVFLGEGNTPLVWSKVMNREIAFKLEFLNPSGSFKDRGTALMVSFLKSKRVKGAMDDSSGNAGASFAAYASFTNLRAKIYLPAYASGPKRDQIEAYGATVIPVSGPRSRASAAVQKAAEAGEVYASHAMLPQGLPGFASIAYELLQQLKRPPGTIILPVGQGSQLLALGRAFQSMHGDGLIDVIPRLIGVQAKACAPFYAASIHRNSAQESLAEGKTLAEGVRILKPHRLDAVVNQVQRSGGKFLVVDEEEILPGQQSLARKGLYVEPTSSIVWSGLHQVIEQVPDPIVVILTGSGLKTTSINL